MGQILKCQTCKTSTSHEWWTVTTPAGKRTQCTNCAAKSEAKGRLVELILEHGDWRLAR